MKKLLILLFSAIFISVSFMQSGVISADETSPAAPRGFDASGGATAFELLLTWTNPSDEDLDHINIYLASSPPYLATIPHMTVSASANTKGIATIPFLASGTNYYLYLAAVDDLGNISDFTTELKRTTSFAKDTTTPEAINDFAAQDAAMDGAIALSWTNSSDEDFFQVHIYRSIESDFAPSAENEVVAVFGLPSEVGSYADSGLINDQIYYYKIRTEDNRDNIQTGLFYPSASATPTFTEPEPEPTPEPEPEPEPTPAPEPDKPTIIDGDLIRVDGTLDIFIVKLINGKKFKRLILNPDIFNSYGHLKWEAVKDVSEEIVGEYAISDLVIEINPDGSIADPKVYRVSSAVNSDTGEKRWLNISAADFETAGLDWDAIYKINQTEASADFYFEGEAISSL